ncbi:MAG: methionine adenosyltransferase [Desulfobacterales bacterium]|nr:methionine adenosyltransferase [Desulfobacterales bacterium]MBF0398191.1 methionine adenosyltransferase [Desulfobacterales bacterium]
MKSDFIFSSESFTEGHPDKLCDQISDAIVDNFLLHDTRSRVVAECAASTSMVFIAARFESKAPIDFSNVARQVIQDIGFTHSSFNSKTCSILTSIKETQGDGIAKFDEKNLTDEEIDKIKSKSQATVFGFACNQTPGLIPLPIWIAHKLAKRLDYVRHKKILSYLSPDAKTHVEVEFINGLPKRIGSITIITSQNVKDEPSINKLRGDVTETVIKEAFSDEPLKFDDKTTIFINPEGPVIIGGPSLHSGVTGRKGAADTYGEYSRNSSSALSGKDPLRLHRLSAYAARYAAKNVVAAKLADECEVHLHYSIGHSNPRSIQVQTFGTGCIEDTKIADRLKNCFDFRIGNIIKKFNLNQMPAKNHGAFYRKISVYGHMGRTDISAPWEETDLISALNK